MNQRTSPKRRECEDSLSILCYTKYLRFRCTEIRQLHMKHSASAHSREYQNLNISFVDIQEAEFCLNSSLGFRMFFLKDNKNVDLEASRLFRRKIRCQYRFKSFIRLYEPLRLFIQSRLYAAHQQPALWGRILGKPICFIIITTFEWLWHPH